MSWNKWKIIPAALFICAAALHFYARSSHSKPLQEAHYFTMITAADHRTAEEEAAGELIGL